MAFLTTSKKREDPPKTVGRFLPCRSSGRLCRPGQCHLGRCRGGRRGGREGERRGFATRHGPKNHFCFEDVCSLEKQETSVQSWNCGCFWHENSIESFESGRPLDVSNQQHSTGAWWNHPLGLPGWYQYIYISLSWCQGHWDQPWLLKEKHNSMMLG